MIAYALVALALVIGGFYAGDEWNAGKVARAELAQKQAQDKVDEAARAAIAQAQHEIDSNLDAFKAGEEKARKSGSGATARAHQDVATLAVFQNPACTLPPQSYGLLLAALRGMRAGAVELPPLDPAVVSAPPAAPASGRPPKPVPIKRAPQ